MTSFLVNQNCIESLQKDITDLQGTIINVFSQAGATRYPSWKFPDKVSCDLDLVSLLDHYDFVENDPEFTQHSHVVLLELVIDRLLLLLQSFTGYTENLTSEQAMSPSKTPGPCMSIGLAVKKYWSSMLKLGALYQQLVAEKKCSKDDVSILKHSLQAAQAGNEHFKSTSALSESDVTLPSFRSASSGLWGRATAVSSQAELSCAATRHVQSTHSQTIESSLVPCDACQSTQASLREVGHAITGICTSQNLPSSLSRFLEMVEETLGQQPLTATDLSYWATEQRKDLSRINKHLQTLTELVNPLKEGLEESEKQKDALKQQLETFEGRLQEEKRAQEQQRREAELLFAKKNAESLHLVAALERDKEDLQNRAASLAKKISTLKEELQRQQATIQELERTQKELLQEMKVKMADKSKVTSLEEQLGLLSGHLESAKQQLSWASTELEKERARAESVLRHKESLQAKQRALMQQLGHLDQECEELKTGLADGEDERQMLQEQLEKGQEEKWELQRQLEAQQELTAKVKQEKLSLEQSTSDLQRTISELGELIRELKERERLLVSFPDLHVPAEMRFESTGDIVADMGRQLQANNIRISILEEENSRLRAAVTKMKEAAQQGAPKMQTQVGLHAGPPPRTFPRPQDRNTLTSFHGLRWDFLSRQLACPTQLWSRNSAKPGCGDGGTMLTTPPAGPLAVTGFQGAALMPPSEGSADPNGSPGGRGSAGSQSRWEKPPAAEPARRTAAVYSLAHEGPAARSPSARTRGRGMGPGQPAHCTRNHRK
ncbi:coiled-coil domain-containing protein 157 isoform X3 [Hemicordylus capensis]|nr:coiled-coil domain-containing protein 157 isoform X3 [Hemicordylus capensis]XP_053135470.1 coiled-coil domain-containing protein 157 isoform X3 [Hemicordylus capensis]